MINILINNEELDIDSGAVVTFKKSQQLNGIQNQYSFSNNFNLKNTSKNRRLLGINYLPNSKAKSMTVGYDCDIILNGCIFLKKQKLKVQKEAQDSIPVYIIFSDSFFVAKAKEVLMSQIVFEPTYFKTLPEFIDLNDNVGNLLRTAPVSAQDTSGLVVLEEVPALMNLVQTTLVVFLQLGYSYLGDFFTDVEAKKYYINPNSGIYGLGDTGGRPSFDPTMTCYDFLVKILKTFNGYIDVSDSSKSVGVFLWKNIEAIKTNFANYSDKFVAFNEYSFEGGLAKKNKLEYSGSPAFYNSFFENNKSIVESTTYLKSDFGAGNMRLFDDQELNEDGTLPLRTDGETTDAKELNLYKFENALSEAVVYSGGVKQNLLLYKATSPNIYDLYANFHLAYTKNIALPTIANFTFRYDAIFLANLSMQRVFFLKQLSTYWLPLELNFSTEKKEIKLKALMVEKTRTDTPVIFDLNVSVGFYGAYTIQNATSLYSAANTSKASVFVVNSFDLTKNNVFITGTDGVRTQILSFPTTVDIRTQFILEVENIEASNVLGNSDLLFQFISEEGGTSREGKINIAHNGRANFLSEFRSVLDTEYHYEENDVDDFERYLNYSAKITSPINIPVTYAPSIGDVDSLFNANLNFRVLQLDKPQLIKVTLSIGNAMYHCSNRGGGALAQTKVSFNVTRNGVIVATVHSNGASDNKRSGSTQVYESNVLKSTTFTANAGDIIAFHTKITGEEENRFLSGTMDGAVTLKNITWKFECEEQL